MTFKQVHACALAGAGIVALAAMPAAHAGPNTIRPPKNCTPVQNVEAIIDDSGSNQDTDPAGLRRNAMLLLIGKKHNTDLTLGAIEFGTEAVRLFEPLPVGPNRETMEQRILGQVASDGTPAFTAPSGGGTDYNAAFALATSENPGAGARIFLTDGGHNEEPYAQGHKQAPAPTFVVGLSVGAPTAPYGADPAADDASQRLQRIADETGGRYFPEVTSSTLQQTVNEIDARLNCGSKPATFGESFFRASQTGPFRRLRTSGRTKRFDVVVNWTQASNVFDVARLVAYDRRGRPVASTPLGYIDQNGVYTAKRRPGARRLPRLRVTRTEGDTYEALSVRRPKRARELHYRVRASQFLLADQVVSQASAHATR